MPCSLLKELCNTRKGRPFNSSYSQTGHRYLWFDGFVLRLMLHCRSSLKGVARMANDLLAHHGQGIPKVWSRIWVLYFSIFFQQTFNQVKLVFLDIEKGRIHLTNDPLTFYWSSHLDDQLTLYCSNTEFILEQQFLLEQGSI